jgi:DNA ligase-1
MIYSRNSENLSDKYPDIISRISNLPLNGVKSFVLDCEAVAWDTAKQCILPFQVLSTRKRKVYFKFTIGCANTRYTSPSMYLCV